MPFIYQRALVLFVVIVLSGLRISNATVTECESKELDFNSQPAGSYIRDQFKDDFQVQIRAFPTGRGYAPNNAARLFDTSNPGTSPSAGDPDLGSPNQGCGGPGVGVGGAPGSLYENCESLGNVLIIQETNKATPDDSSNGGRIEFTFEFLASIDDIWILDAEEQVTVTTYGKDGNVLSSAPVPGGDNGLSKLDVNKGEVKKLVVLFRGSGAVAKLTYELCTSEGKGDPHFLTWKGESFDYHGQCDMVFVHSDRFADGLGLDMHIRTKRKDTFSFIRAAAIRIGDDVLEIRNDFTYYLNGVRGEVDFTQEEGEETESVGGFALRHTIPQDNKTGKKLEGRANNHFYTIDLGGNGESIIIRNVHRYLGVQVKHPQDSNFGDSVGLLGSFGDGSMLARDGSTILSDGNDFGPEWQVLDTEPKLFQQSTFPQYPQKCLPPNAASEQRRLNGSSASSKISRSLAEKACGQLSATKMEQCVFDVMATGDPEMATAFHF